MDRSAKVSESPGRNLDDEDLYDASPAPPSASRGLAAQGSLSPSTSISSDKENRSSRTTMDKGKGKPPMGPPAVPSNERTKRKRAVDHDTQMSRTRRRRTVEADEEDLSTNEYDPDQDIEERRQVRKGLRDLSKRVAENRSDYLAAGSTGIRDTLLEANRLTDKVKQTSDATIDSRLLVYTADLSWQKTVALTSGDMAQGVDLEEFISKCRNYLRSAPEAADGGSQEAPSNTQRRRGRNDDEDGEDDDMFDWAYFGRYACLPHIKRPSVPGFLLGPLSVERRARRAVERKAGLKLSAIRETRPEVLQRGEIEKSENANLSNLCSQIHKRVDEMIRILVAKVEREATAEMTQEEIDKLMDRHGVSEDGGLALFKFVINPWSFGQTVENIFYVSFLIRDGLAGIVSDKRGLPYLELTKPRDRSEAAQQGQHKHQAVISIDNAKWRELIEIFDIKEPMIRHREEDQHNMVGKQGWF